jgi:hypothetical protein
MKRQASTATWVPLSSIQRLDAIGKLARTRDRVPGYVLHFKGRNVTLQAWNGQVTASVGECEVKIAQASNEPTTG